jgi:hypothetical protein
MARKANRVMRQPFIETRTGKRFEPLSPDPALICIEDIAHALSHQCRFSGHTSRHYSVAEHSVRVAELLARWGYGIEMQIGGLLHDAYEAYAQDVASPIKHTPEMAPYREIEAAGMVAIAKRFDLARGFDKSPPVVEADLTMLATEARDLMPFRLEHWGDVLARVRPLTDQIPTTPLHPEHVRVVFLQTYARLEAAR